MTNRPLRLVCTAVGGVLVAGFWLAGAYRSVATDTGPAMLSGLAAFLVLLLACLLLDLRLAWSFRRFAAKHQTPLIIHLFVGQALGLTLAWHVGLPVLKTLALGTALVASFLFLGAALVFGVVFTLSIAGPSRVCTLCGAAGVGLGAWHDGVAVLSRVEVWTLLVELLPFEADWLTWAWTIVLALCWFYDRDRGFFEFV